MSVLINNNPVRNNTVKNDLLESIPVQWEIPLKDGRVVLYQVETHLSVAEFKEVLVRSTLGQRRPLDNAQRMAAMLDHANLVVTARTDGGQLIGLARSVTDFSFCCYLSDLAVDEAYQKQGIGRHLVRLTREAIGPETQLLLLAAPAAKDYYAHIGFRAVPNAWSLDATS